MKPCPKVRVRGGALLLAALTLSAASDDTADPAEEPRKIGLVERAERGLAQLDVSVRGPWEAISDLTVEDFELVINGQLIEGVIVDRLCSQPDPSEKASKRAAAEPPSPAVEAGPASLPDRLPASFLFYFDQQLMSGAGRQNSIDLTREMIPKLIRDGNRAAIVSSGRRLATLADLTDDVDVLLETLDRLERDREQWVAYPQEEDFRIREVLETLENLGIYSACGTARRFQREESWHTDKALRLFSLTLGHLAELDPPKVVFYFADKMRSNAGMHYMTYVGGCASTSDGGGPDAGDLGGFGAVFAIDRVIEEAAAHGTRVYAVRPEGLVAETLISARSGIRAGETTNQQRVSQAGDSLAGLALETGGRFFINGEGSSKIVKAVDADLGCMYLLSFDPTGLPQDKPLRVLLRTKRPKVKAFVRGRAVLQSESARRTSKLMAAFAAPGSVRTDTAIGGVIVPTGFADGRYTALVQISAPGSPLSEAEWDLGASLLSRGEFKEDASGRVAVKQRGVPVVFETEMSFKPGPYELILVAHESVSSQMGTKRIEGHWPERGEGAAIGPIAVIQPADGVFVREGETRLRGAMGKEEKELLRTDLPTALVGLVCRGSSKKERLRIERLLIGETETRFPEMEIELGDERCAQVRDLIPASTMTPGRFVYRIRIVQGETEIASTERSFAAIDEPSAESWRGKGGSAP